MMRGWLVLMALVATVAGCSNGAVDQRKADVVLDSTKEIGAKTADATATAAEAAKDIAGDAADKGAALVTAAGEAVTDTWITAKVTAKLGDERLLDGSDITVATSDHRVTLTGTVATVAARARALAIAGGTEQVTGVIDQLVVKRG